MPQLSFQPPEYCQATKDNDETITDHSNDRERMWSILTDFLNHTIDLTEAEILAAFREMLIDAQQNGHTEYFHDDLNFVIQDIAEQIPAGNEAAGKLAKIVVRLSQSDDENPILNPQQFSDHLFSSRMLLFPRGGSRSVLDVSVTKHINWHNFLSQLHQVTNLEHLTHIAVMQLRDALEVDYDQPDTELKGSCVSSTLWVARETSSLSTEEAILKVHNGMVTAAYMWIKNMGPTLFTEVAKRWKYKPTDDYEDTWLQAGQDYGGRIYGRERWDFWKKGFETAAEGQRISGEGAALAREAAKTMTELEQSEGRKESGFLSSIANYV